MTDLISLPEYAARIGKHPDIVRQKCLRGNLPGAIKIGRDWLIPPNTPYTDNRVKSGKYKNWRKEKSPG